MNIERVNLDMEQERWFAEYTKAPTVIILAFCTIPSPGLWKFVDAMTNEQFCRITNIEYHVSERCRSAIAVRVYHLRGGDDAANVN